MFESMFLTVLKSLYFMFECFYVRHFVKHNAIQIKLPYLRVNMCTFCHFLLLLFLCSKLCCKLTSSFSIPGKSYIDKEMSVLFVSFYTTAFFFVSFSFLLVLLNQAQHRERRFLIHRCSFFGAMPSRLHDTLTISVIF